jgi:hypothetical protein
MKKRNSIKPYISVVAAARNDDHGGNLLDRMQCFQSALIEQCNRCHLDAELILIEWNPPADRPRLVEALHWPSRPRACRARIIEVPAEIHERYDHAEALPLFQMIAKNVGIRRAEGEFVLATNIDILFSNQLMEFLAARRLSSRRMYRIDRMDVPPDIPRDGTLDHRLAYCRENVLRVGDRFGTRNLETGQSKGAYIRVSRRDRAIDAALDRIYPRAVRHHTRLHTNACGDFTLVHADVWRRIRGYPEFEMYSMHLDALGCYLAHHAGAREIVLQDPMQIYHIEHGTGSGFTPEGMQTLYDRLSEAGIPWLDSSQLYEWALQMRRTRAPIEFNAETWGLGADELRETQV